MDKPTHTYRLLDQVWHAADSCPFTVVGVRLHEVEIEGDFSGGTQVTREATWVPANEVEPWQEVFRGRTRTLHDPTPGSQPNLYRYVAAGTPTLLATYEAWLANQEPWYALQVMNRPPRTLRQMLGHERPLWIIELMKLCHVLELSIDEAQARYWANAPAAKIAEQQAVEDNIAQLHTLAAARKLFEPNL